MVLFYVEQRSPTFLASGSGFVEDNFSMDLGRCDGSGGNGSDGEWQRKLCSLTHCSLPAVRPGSEEVLVRGPGVGDP